MVTTTQSVLLSLLGVILLCQGNVINKPFYGLSQLARICFAVNIGSYVYRIFQDVILQRDLNKVSVDIVHHVVTVAVYTVFLFYKQNVLFGALGMLFAMTTPCVEIRRLMKAAEMQEQPNRFYRANLLVCSVLTLLARLIIPAALIIWSLIQGSPLTMDVVVVAVYFLSVIFFGALNIWLAITSITSIYRCWHKYRTDKLTRVLNAGEPHGLEIQASDRSKFTTKRNDINYMMPCSNANIAPQRDLPTNAQRCNLPSSCKTYYKTNVADVLGNPPASALSGRNFNNRRRRSEGSHDSSSSDGLIPGATETNVHVQINDFERSSLSWDDSSSRVSLPLPTVSNLARSRESSSTTSDVETLHDLSYGERQRHMDVNDALSVAETDRLFMDRKLPKHGECSFNAGLSSTTRSDRVPLTRSLSGGALDGNSNHIYSMQMAIMSEHLQNSSHASGVCDLRQVDNGLRHESINQSPPSSLCSDVSGSDRPRNLNSS